MSYFDQTTPESVGISSKTLLRVMQKLSQLTYLNSIMILRHGKLCCETWCKPFTREMPHQLFSLSKSFTSCAVGFAIAENRIRLTDKLVSFFPEYDPDITDPRMRDVTIQDLLTMRSGHKSCARRFMIGKQDYVKGYLSSPLDVEPGTFFAYNSAASYMLASVIRKVTSENVREYLIPRLFDPLKISPGIWECCPMGTNLGGWGFYLTTEDIAKFAQLLLQHGEWEGHQLLPAEYLAEATKKQADNSINELPDWKQGYGYHFWRSRHGYRGDGSAGQFAVVLEKEDMAIATTAGMAHMGSILEVIWEYLLPELSEKPLPENPAAAAELKRFMDGMNIPVESGDLQKRHPAQVFRFQPNSIHLHSCEVTFSEQGCSLTFETEHGTEQLRAGFGHFEYSVLQLNDELPHLTAASAAFKEDHTLQITSMICDGIYQDVWTIDFEDRTEPVKHIEKCGCFRPQKPHFLLADTK